MASAAACATASETPRIALAPRRDLSRVPSRAINVASIAAWSVTSIPMTLSAISFSTFQTAFWTPLPPYRETSPSRSSRASCLPVEAPDGTIAVPLPDSVYAVTEIVGFPRESNTSSAESPVSRTTTRKSKWCAREALLLGPGGDRYGPQAQMRMNAEAVVEQKRGVGGRVAGRVEDHHDEVPAVASGGCEHATTRVVCQAGLEPGDARVAPQHRVQVVRIERLVRRAGGNGYVLCIRDCSQGRVVLVDISGDVHQVVSGHSVARGVEPGWVDEVACGQPDACRLLVHLPNEPVAGHDSARQGFSGVVARVEEEPVKQLAHR